MLQKYAIFQADENGTAYGRAIGVGEAEQTENWIADRRVAIVDGLMKLQKCAPEDITDRGWHTAQRLEGYLADTKNRLTDLQTEVKILENG